MGCNGRREDVAGGAAPPTRRGASLGGDGAGNGRAGRDYGGLVRGVSDGAPPGAVFEEGQEIVVPDDRNIRVDGRSGYIVTGPSPRTTLYSMPSSTVVRR